MSSAGTSVVLIAMKMSKVQRVLGTRHAPERHAGIPWSFRTRYPYPARLDVEEHLPSKRAPTSEGRPAEPGTEHSTFAFDLRSKLAILGRPHAFELREHNADHGSLDETADSGREKSPPRSAKGGA